ncbi:hypothetical protein L914_10977, partial [Phytophthora nicotianae]
KVNEFGHSSRTSVPVENADIEFDEEQGSFERVCPLAEEKVSSALTKYNTKTTRPDRKLYLRPSQLAKQAQFVAMTSKTWSGKLVQVRANYHKQKTFDGPYVVHLLLHAANEVRQGIRRVTPARIAEAADAIDTYLAERSDVRVGGIARTHWAINQARQPHNAGVSLPESATFRQML